MGHFLVQPSFFLIWLGLLCFSAKTLAMEAPPPILIDARVVEAFEGPFLEPSEWILQQGQEYVLILQNDNHFAVNFHYDTFGQNVFTRLLQGAPNVYQTGFGLPSYSRVLWHFSPSLAGEFSFYISNSGMNQAGKPGKILVNGLKSPSEKGTSSTEEQSAEKSTAPIKKSWFKRLFFWKKSAEKAKP